MADELPRLDSYLLQIVTSSPCSFLQLLMRSCRSARLFCSTSGHTEGVAVRQRQDEICGEIHASDSNRYNSSR